jgi:glycosyltransferase involved in cell wall biosynthesis
MTFPKITVITPSFNQGEYLEATINSVLDQQYPDVEYMIIDGGSTDDSAAIIQQYSNHLAYWVSEKDKGQAHAINKGLLRASGEIITWINSDDQLLPGSLKRVAHIFNENPDVDLIHGKTILFGMTHTEIVRGMESSGKPYCYLAGMCFPQPSSFFTRRIVEKVGVLDEAFHYGMDYDFFLRIFLQGSFQETDEVFSKYLLHDNSKTIKVQAQFAQDWAKVYSKLLRSFSFTTPFIQHMKSLGLYTDGSDTYVVSKTIDYDFIAQSFPYFLRFQIIFYYQFADLQQVRKLTGYLNEMNPEFVFSHNLKSVYWRSRMLPGFLLKMLRKL